MFEGVGPRPTRWAVFAYLSGLVSFTTLTGNVALFAVRPPTHWPALESLETLELAAMIPVALALHKLNHSSTLSVFITGVGVVGMLLGLAVSAAFASSLLTFGVGPVAVIGLVGAWLAVLVWLLIGNLLAWRGHSVPRELALLGAASAVTGHLLYPAWALLLGRQLGSRAAG
jgi:hypothetical protein